MVSFEVGLTVFLSIVFSLIVAYIAIVYILPVVRSLIRNIMDNGPVSGFMSLLIIVVYILLVKGILGILKQLPQTAEDGSKNFIGYLSVLEPGMSILDSLLPYLGWVLFGVLVGFGLGNLIGKRK